MFEFRCFHPPAAAISLIVVLGHIGNYRYAFFPVMIDSALLILAGAAYSNITGKLHPKPPLNKGLSLLIWKGASYLILPAAIDALQSKMP